MMTLVRAVVLLISLKYLLLFLGYLASSLVTLAMRMSSRSVSVGREKEGTCTPPQRDGGQRDRPSGSGAVSDLFVRLINGWLLYSITYTGRIPSHGVRNFLYRHAYHVNMGKHAIIYGRGEIRAPYNVWIGEGSIIGDECKLDGRRGIRIGKHVNFSTGVWIWTDQHDPQCPDFSGSGQGGPVTVGDRVWISSRTVILPGITIGEGAVIAAGAVVTKDVEPFSIYGGVPARKIGERNRDLVYEFTGGPLFFY